MVHNPAVRRLLAACLLVVLVAMATTEGIACPDGCQSAGSPSAADRCNDSGACIFCTGGVVAVATKIVAAPQVPVLPAPLSPIVAPAILPSAVPDRPPRLT